MTEPAAQWRLVPWDEHVRTDPRTGKGGGVAGALLAYSHYAETGRIGSYELALLVALVRGVDWRNGASMARSRPSVATLARWSGMSRRKATYALLELVELGIVDREQCAVTGRKELDANAYTLWVPVRDDPSR